jgi:hypothetical protein
MDIKQCKNLDYEGDFPGCNLKSCAPEYPEVKYWERTIGLSEGDPVNVQFCKRKKIRINGIFDCYNVGELPCQE